MVSTREAIESLYIGTFNSYIFESVTDPVTHQTVEKKVLDLENIPCRLSYNTVYPTQYRYENMGIPEVKQVIKVFCSPEITIKSGSVLEVTQNGHTVEYKQSGVPAYHSNHQEISLQYGENYG